MKTIEWSRCSAAPDRRSTFNADRLQRTLDAARLLQSTLDLKQLTRIILEIVRNEVLVDRVTAFILDRNRNLLHSLVAQGVDDHAISMPMDKGIAGFVAQTRQTLDVTDAYADARFNPEFDRLLGYQTNDIFAMPVLNNSGNVVGVLELINRKQPINQEDREFLQDISVFVGLALENASLHEELRNKARIEEELARCRERLAQMDRLSLMSEVLTTVVRELTSPLSIVTNHAGLLKQDPAASPATLRYAGIIQAAAASSTESVKKFVNFIQTQGGQKDEVDLTQLVRQTIAVRASSWALDGIEAKEDLQPTPHIVGNEAEIQQAVMNLIKNAEDATMTNDGPRLLTIRTLHDAAQNKVAIDVGDNGVGIATRHYELVFEPFFSTKRQTGGTGLGLTIANRVIQEHQGEILFDSSQDRGSVFTIELPVNT
jgi:signal transduction histidine kinase